MHRRYGSCRPEGDQIKPIARQNGDVRLAFDSSSQKTIEWCGGGNALSIAGPDGYSRTLAYNAAGFIPAVSDSLNRRKL